ncbi:PIG-L deacetylase family protein [Baekduia soli]|nr:PIG-L deacetylase family protein [Baekduia soli]
MIGAHPDDIDFNAAGCAIAWRAQGVDVTWCVVTDGQSGGFDADLDRAEVPAQRRGEQRAAARAAGVEDVVFLGLRDGEVADDPALRRELARVIRRVRPVRLLVHSPERDWSRVYQCHPDHLAVGAAALAAVYPEARNPFSHTELLEAGLEPHAVPETWLYGAPAPDLAVDVTAEAAGKEAVLACHVSQHDAAGGLITAARRAGEDAGAAAGMAAGRVAEVFQRVDTR